MKNLIEEKIARKQKALTWTEPELIELNAYLRDIAEGYCGAGGAVFFPFCAEGALGFLEDCDVGNSYSGG